jgi:hypothetical protein
MTGTGEDACVELRESFHAGPTLHKLTKHN